MTHTDETVSGELDGDTRCGLEQIAVPELPEAVNARAAEKLLFSEPWGIPFFEDEEGVDWGRVPEHILGRFTPEQLRRLKQYRLGMADPLDPVRGDFGWVGRFVEELEACGATGHFKRVPSAWQTGGYE